MKELIDKLLKNGLKIDIKLWGNDREKIKNKQLWKSQEKTDEIMKKIKDKIKKNTDTICGIILLILSLYLAGCSNPFGDPKVTNSTSIKDSAKIEQVTHSTSTSKQTLVEANNNRLSALTIDTMTIAGIIKTASDNNVVGISSLTINIITSILEKFNSPLAIWERGDVAFNKNINIPNDTRIVKTYIKYPDGKIEEKEITEPVYKPQPKVIYKKDIVPYVLIFMFTLIFALIHIFNKRKKR